MGYQCMVSTTRMNVLVGMVVMALVVLVVALAVTCSQKYTLQEELQQQTYKLQQQDTALQQLKQNSSNLEESLQCQQQLRVGPSTPAQDCQDLMDHHGITESGVYEIFPVNFTVGVPVKCEIEEGEAWTVFLDRHRQNPQENFRRTWDEYKTGFGDPPGEYWLGNEYLHTLTLGCRGTYSLKVEAKDLEGEPGEGVWASIKVDNEENRYRLHLQGYSRSSTLGDALTGSEEPYNCHLTSNGMSFSTWDRDNDKKASNCADVHDAGWWFNRCGYAHPTGLLRYKNGNWYVACWDGFHKSHYMLNGLSQVKLMIRRR